MLLLIDIGNTSTKAGFHDGGSIIKTLNLRTFREGRDIDEYDHIFTDFVQQHQMQKPEGAALCSVVPGVTPIVEKALKKNFGINPIILTYKIKTGLQFRNIAIKSLGADRIANAVAATNIYGGNIVVVDFGTATTFCTITEDGEYRGGAIMPGLGLSAESLAEKTAKLPVVELIIPDRVLGRNTQENILTGVILGHAGAVERIISEIKRELDKDVTVVATGGFVNLIKPLIKVTYINPYLTLEGLRFIYELNS
jgi:type III pantothenate kinase